MPTKPPEADPPLDHQDESVSALKTCVETVVSRIAAATREGANNARWKKMAPPEIAAMTYIGGRNEPMVSQLAAHLGVAMTTASALVDRLVRQGIVRRTRSEQDRRTVLLSLTPEGKAIYDVASAEKRMVCARMLNALAPADRPAFVRAMQTIADRFLACDATGPKEGSKDGTP
jgi:DNA-binding MarR family transcriptional regulator